MSKTSDEGTGGERVVRELPLDWPAQVPHLEPTQIMRETVDEHFRVVRRAIIETGVVQEWAKPRPPKDHVRDSRAYEKLMEAGLSDEQAVIAINALDGFCMSCLTDAAWCCSDPDER